MHFITNLRSVVYCNGIRFGGRPEWNYGMEGEIGDATIVASARNTAHLHHSLIQRYVDTNLCLIASHDQR